MRCWRRRRPQPTVCCWRAIRGAVGVVAHCPGVACRGDGHAVQEIVKRAGGGAGHPRRGMRHGTYSVVAAVGVSVAAAGTAAPAAAAPAAWQLVTGSSVFAWAITKPANLVTGQQLSGTRRFRSPDFRRASSRCRSAQTLISAQPGWPTAPYLPGGPTASASSATTRRSATSLPIQQSG